MGLLKSLKNVGSKIFGKADTSEAKEAKIVEHLNSFDLGSGDLRVKVDGDRAILSGTAKDAFDKIRIIATAGNVEGIAEVNGDALLIAKKMEVNLEEAEEEVVEEEEVAQYHTVVSGDTLSKIAKKYYGNAMKYPQIFEANQPMLKSPDLIYPGQVLVIPNEDEVKG